MSREATAAVLAARARELAMPLAAARSGAETEVIEVELAGERYAIETRYVVAVAARADAALLPGTEPPLVGLAAWRGELLPLLDLRWILGLAAAGDPSGLPIVVLGDERPAFAVTVDALHGVRVVSLSAVTPLPADGSRGRELLLGATSDAMLLLAADRLVRVHSPGVQS